MNAESFLIKKRLLILTFNNNHGTNFLGYGCVGGVSGIDDPSSNSSLLVFAHFRKVFFLFLPWERHESICSLCSDGLSSRQIGITWVAASFTPDHIRTDFAFSVHQRTHVQYLLESRPVQNYRSGLADSGLYA